MTASLFLRTTLLLAALGASGPAWPAALSADSGAGAVGGIELEICRLPGSSEEYSGSVINIPAGTTFTDDVFDLGQGAPSPSAAPLTVTTTAPASLAASAFCLRVPVKPVTPADRVALSASFGRMFVASGKGTVTLGHVFDRVYGLLRSGPG